ncbi:MAG TPA: NAD(P)/FAD-dependent oxidoreductase [Steroidobacter sp.]|nr:NAD(P)/FAD-dependent oxidoreductase [Steroidobacter sp.]
MTTPQAEDGRRQGLSQAPGDPAAGLDASNRIANFLRKLLPAQLSYRLTRWKNVLFGMFLYRLCKARPALAKRGILKRVREELGPEFDVDEHFTPRDNPWEQRLCLVPDSDLFIALKERCASIVTDHLETFTEKGLKLRSGKELEADLIVTATGLELLALGGLQASVDGRNVDFSKMLTYKGMMYSDVPNFASAFGYTNASWTLKCDLTSQYVCRLLNYMDKHSLRQCTPRRTDPSVQE